MRNVFLAAALLAALCSTGCLGKRGAKPAPAASPVSANASPSRAGSTVTPAAGLKGTVTAVNANLRFAVLTFPSGPMPGAGQYLGLYRQGLKVGVLKVTGPQSDQNTVADIVTGEAQNGDEVREQ